MSGPLLTVTGQGTRSISIKLSINSLQIRKKFSLYVHHCTIGQCKQRWSTFNRHL